MPRPHPIRRLRYQSQRGVALLAALLTMAIAVMIAGAIVATQYYDIRMVSNIQDLERAFTYVQAIEDTAGVWLRRDLDKNDFDSLEDMWAEPIPALPINENGSIIGSVEGSLSDAQALFNLNNLLDKDSKPNSNARQQLDRLLTTHKIPVNFSASILDWLDKDVVPSPPDGAENDYYISGENSYLSANNLLVDKSELFLIKSSLSDLDEKRKLFDELLPDVITLPKPTSININTANANVLNASGLDATVTDEIIKTREDNPYDKNELATLRNRVQAEEKAKNSNQASNTQNTANTDEAASNAIWDSLGVDTHYFALRGSVMIGKAQLFFYSLLERSPEGQTHVIMRQFNYATEQPSKQDTAKTS